ncbi:MAG TPA: hypothetical protein VFO07_03955, partial [Roseiflexaceae bacterium]|nr:hypothetical protein [Roseiflexaceae bacterium]
MRRCFTPLFTVLAVAILLASLSAGSPPLAAENNTAYYLPIIARPGDGAPSPTTTATAQPSATATATTQPSPTVTSTPSATATATTQPSPTATQTSQVVQGIRGQVRVKPRWAVTTQQPVAYEVIFDVSGSMSWTFAGMGWRNGRAIDCNAVSSCSNADAWPDKTLRRIHIVKQALNQLIDAMGAEDTMRIVTFAGNLSSDFDNQRAIDMLTKAWPTSGWSGDKALLKASALDAGATQGDPYLPNGRSANPVGIAAGAQDLARAPTNAPNGQPYQHVVIFLTDSVANVFLDGEISHGDDICPANVNAPNLVACQIGTTADGRLRPVSAMIEQAQLLKQSRPTLPLYVLAIGVVDTTGMEQVASTPNMLFHALEPAQMSPMLAQIQAQVRISLCTPAGGDSWVDQIDAAHTPAFAPPDTLPAGVFGYAYLYDQQGNPLPAGQHQLPIAHNPTT